MSSPSAPPVTAESRFLEELSSGTLTGDDLLWWFATGSGRGRNETAPSDFILDALPADGQRPGMAWKLAGQMAAVLRSHPTLQPTHPMAEEAMTHLLRTAARLGSPVPLTPPLWDAYFALRETGRPISPLVGPALLTALIYNPSPETRAHDLWLRLLRGEPDPLFGGTPEHGILGIMLTEDAAAKGSPDYTLAGEGFKLLGRYYDRTDRAVGFQRMRKRLRQFVDLWQISDPMGMVRMAHNAQWHENEETIWLHKTLPVLFAELPILDGSKRCLVWYGALDLFTRYVGSLEPPMTSDGAPWCGGEFQIIRYTEDKAKFARDLLATLSVPVALVKPVSEFEFDYMIKESVRWGLHPLDQGNAPEMRTRAASPKHQPFLPRYGNVKNVCRTTTLVCGVLSGHELCPA